MIRLASALAFCAALFATDWGSVTAVDTGDRGVTLENSRIRVRYGQYTTSDVGVKDAIVELVAKPGGINLAGRIDSRSASHSKGRANRLTSVKVVEDGKDRKAVRLDFGDGAAVQEVSIYPDAPWIEITYHHHDVNIFDTASPKLEYEIAGAADWAAARGWSERYPAYPDSYYRRQWGSAGPLEYHGNFILGAHGRASGQGYGRVMPSSEVDVIKLLFSRGFEMFPHYQPRREQRSFTGYIFVVRGGADQILLLGRKLSDRSRRPAGELSPSP